MSLGKTDPTVLLRAQLNEAAQANAAMQGLLGQRWSETVQDVANGLASLIANARGGNVNAQNLLKQFFVNLDEARAAAESKIVLPPGAAKAPVLLQSGAGEVPDGEAVEAGNVL